MPNTKHLHVMYTNWRGEQTLRTIEPQGLRFGTSEWHPTPQWLLDAMDIRKGVRREFALKDCVFLDGEDTGIQDRLETLKEEYLRIAHSDDDNRVSALAASALSKIAPGPD